MLRNLKCTHVFPEDFFPPIYFCIFSYLIVLIFDFSPGEFPDKPGDLGCPLMFKKEDLKTSLEAVSERKAFVNRLTPPRWIGRTQSVCP